MRIRVSELDLGPSLDVSAAERKAAEREAAEATRATDAGRRVPRTIVIFSSETDGRPQKELKGFGERANNESDFRYVQCTCACAMIVPINQLPSLKGATELTCWRDVATSPGANPFEPLFEAFDHASIIVGFNQLEFDLPLLFKHYGKGAGGDRYIGHRIKCLDIFSRLRAVTGHWPELDDLLKTNGLPAKSGDTRQAIRMWDDDFRTKLEGYCRRDVCHTAQLALLPRMRFGQTTIPEHVYGLMPALAAVAITEEEGEYVVV